MDWQGALRKRLVTDNGVNALVVQRVYWMDRPQASALPAITLQTVSELRPQHMKGFDGLDFSRVQIDCWAATYAKAQEVKESVIAAVAGEYTGDGIHFERAFIDGIRDLGERTETAFIHRTSLDMIFHHSTE